MYTSSKHSHIHWALCLALAGALTASCTNDVQTYELDGHNQLQIPTSDLAHMATLMQKHGGRMRLDFSDDSQYRFILARAAASGKTRDNSPEFYASLDRIRTRHVEARANGVEPTGTSPGDVSKANDRAHLVATFVILPGNAGFEASAFSTVLGGSDYTYVDAVVWDENWNQISDYGWAEDYVAGKKLVARAYGSEPLDPNYIVNVDSFELVDVGGVEEADYAASVTRAPNSAQQIEPADFNDDGIITVCLNRNYSDCDYPAIGQLKVKFPMKGSIRFAFKVVDIITDTAETYAKLSKIETGGVHEMEFGTFADWVFIDPSDPSGKTVAWDIPRDLAVFDGDLFHRYEEVNFFTNVTVDAQRGTHVTRISGMLSSVQTDNTFEIVPPMQIVWSCLAKGTQIRMADGSAMNIEDIGKGTAVRTDATGLGFDVIDVSTGIETVPMVRIRDEEGRTLLMTESHPIVTADRGIVWAADLKAGDVVETESGASELVEVSREMYSGSVHNVKLDKGADPASTAVRGSTMYANGFLVGDLAMQSAYEFKNNHEESSVLERLPSAWHTDYKQRVEPEHR